MLLIVLVSVGSSTPKLPGPGAYHSFGYAHPASRSVCVTLGEARMAGLPSQPSPGTGPLHLLLLSQLSYLALAAPCWGNPPVPHQLYVDGPVLSLTLGHGSP